MRSAARGNIAGFAFRFVLRVHPNSRRLDNVTGRYVLSATRTGQYMNMRARASHPFGEKYAFVVVAAIFLALLAAAGLRANPWRAAAALADIARLERGNDFRRRPIGIFLYGLTGPFAAADDAAIRPAAHRARGVCPDGAGDRRQYLHDRALAAFPDMGRALRPRLGGRRQCAGATIVNRWFATHRGLIMGLLTASASTGTLIFLPGLAALASWPAGRRWC